MKELHACAVGTPSTDREDLISSLLRDIATLTPAEFKLAAYVYSLIQAEGGGVRASIAELAAAVGLSWRTTQACRAALIAKGVLTITSVGRSRGTYDVPRRAIPPEPDVHPQPEEPPAMQPCGIADLLGRLIGSTSLTSQAQEVVGGSDEALLRVLRSLADDGCTFDPTEPRLFLTALMYRTYSLQHEAAAEHGTSYAR